MFHFDHRCANRNSKWREIFHAWRERCAMRLAWVLGNGVRSRQHSYYNYNNYNNNNNIQQHAIATTTAHCSTSTTTTTTTTTITFQLQVQQQLQLPWAASNHLSVHQWVRSAIHDSQELTSPIMFPIFETFETSATALWCTYWYTIPQIPIKCRYTPLGSIPARGNLYIYIY